MLKLCSFIGIIALFMGCQTTTAYVTTTFPPPISLDKSKTIAVGALKGDYSNQITNSLESVLLKKGFTVVDRQKLGQVIDEKLIGQSGSIIPADILITGQVTDFRQDVDEFSEGLRCIDPANKSEYTGSSKILKGHGIANASIRFIDAKTGKLLASQDISGESFDEKRLDQCTSIVVTPIEINRQLLISKSMKDLQKSFENTILPFEDSFVVEVFDIDEDKAPLVNTGNKNLVKGDLEGAKSLYKQSMDRINTLDTKSKAHLYYNYGVSVGLTNSPSEGIKLIKQAYSLNPEEKYLNIIGTIERREAKL